MRLRSVYRRLLVDLDFIVELELRRFIGLVDVVDLARSFGVVTVGEWVGDERTVQLLEKAGVSYMQGYFFGAPELTKDEDGREAQKPAS